MEENIDRTYIMLGISERPSWRLVAARYSNATLEATSEGDDRLLKSNLESLEWAQYSYLKFGSGTGLLEPKRASAM